MPLTGTGPVLGALIKTNIDALSDEDKQDRNKIFEEIGKAVIAHLTGAAGVGAVSGVTVGAGTAKLV